MWFWIITGTIVGGGTIKLFSTYMFARQQDAQQHLVDTQEQVWKMAEDNGADKVLDIEIVFKPQRISDDRRN